MRSWSYWKWIAIIAIVLVGFRMPPDTTVLALDPPPDCTDAMGWGTWAKVNFSPKVVNLDDTATITFTIVGGPPSGTYCSWGSWTQTGTSAVSIYNPDPSCFDIVDYSPKADDLHTVNVSEDGVSWVAQTKDAMPTWISEECYCYYDGATHSIMSKCPSNLLTSGNWEPGATFSIELKAKCSRTDDAWIEAGLGWLTGDWGIGHSAVATDYYKFGGELDVQLTATPSTLPSSSSAGLSAEVTEKNSGVKLPRQMVEFSMVSGSGTLQPMSAVTDASGQAFSNLGSGGFSGNITARADVPDDSDSKVITFTEVEPEPTDSDNNLGDQPDIPYTGEPIHPGTGNLYFSQPLFSLPGLLLPIEFEVSYNSRDNNRDSGLGFGWNHSFDVFVTQTGDEVTVKWADGRKDSFKDDGTGTFLPLRSKTSATLNMLDPEGYEVVLPNQVRYTFDANGRLVTINDLNDNQILLDHSTRLDRITDPVGRQIVFTYTGDRITSIATPIVAGPTVAFAYDGSGNLTTITDARLNPWTFTYDDDHQMLTHADARGNTVISNTYDANGRVIQQVDALGGVYSLVYEEQQNGGMHTTITSPTGDVVRHYYDRAMNIIKIIDGKGGENLAAYNPDGRMSGRENKNGMREFQLHDNAGNPVLIQDTMGGRTSITYNEFNLPSQVVDPAGGISTFVYDDRGNLTNSTDPLKRVWKRTYDGRGLPLTVIDPLAKTWSFTYNSAGLPATSTDPAGNQTAYTYNDAGNLIKVTLPGGSFHEMTYDPGGNLLTRTDPMGFATTFAYDENGNPTSRTFQPTGAVTTFFYDAANHLTKIVSPTGGEATFMHNGYRQIAAITDPDQITMQFTQDELDRPVTCTGAGAAITQFAYDNEGHLLSRVNPIDETFTYGYDLLGRVSQTADPLGGTCGFVYDNAGRLISAQNELGHCVLFTYDLAGQMTKIVLADERSYQYHYDQAGNIKKLIDPLNRVWAFAYNDIDLLETVTDPAGKTETMTYDNRGRLTQRQLRTGEQISYVWDDNGRLSSITTPGPRTIAMSYRPDGKPLSISDSSGAMNMAYDLGGRRTSFTDNNGKTVAFAYTPGGRVDTITYPNDHVLQHAYDAWGRLESLLDWKGNSTTFSYDAADKLTGVTLPNGTSTQYTYDNAGRLARLRHLKSDDTEIYAPEFTRDAAGQIIGITGTAYTAPSPAEDKNIQYDHDQNNRLLTTSSDGIVFTNTFDDRGNLVSGIKGSTTTVYTYDLLNRLLSVTDGTHTTGYGYTGTGIRISKSYDGATLHYLNDGAAIYCTYTDSGTVENYFVLAGGVLLYSLDENGAIIVYHGDERGNVVAVTDTAQNVIETTTYGPYGEEIAHTGNLYNPFRFMGKLGVPTDENGLIHARARYYDPDLRRFINEDPLGVLQEPNLYAYAGGNPINFADPSGLSYGTGIDISEVPKVDTSVLQNLRNYYEAKGDQKAVDELNGLDEKLHAYAVEQESLYQEYLEQKRQKKPAKITVCTATYSEIKNISDPLDMKRFKIGQVAMGKTYWGEGLPPDYGHFAATLVDTKSNEVVAVIDPIQAGLLGLGQIDQKRVTVYTPSGWSAAKGWAYVKASDKINDLATGYEKLVKGQDYTTPADLQKYYDMEPIDWYHKR